MSERRVATPQRPGRAARRTRHALRTRFGGERGDELPEGPRTSGGRRKLQGAAKQALAASAPRRPRRSRAPQPRLVECRRRLRQDWELERHVVPEHAAWHAAGIASDDSRRIVGARADLKTTRGWVHGYNAQAVVGDGQIVLVAEISTESLDTANREPIIRAYCKSLRR